MAEKVSRLEKMATKPVSMKLFAAWEDRTPPNCIPRLCSLIITRLTILSPLPVDLSSVSLAVKMQSSKRTLRSHEIPVQQVQNAVSQHSATGTASGAASNATAGQHAVNANLNNANASALNQNQSCSSILGPAISITGGGGTQMLSTINNPNLITASSMVGNNAPSTIVGTPISASSGAGGCAIIMNSNAAPTNTHISTSNHNPSGILNNNNNNNMNMNNISINGSSNNNSNNNNKSCVPIMEADLDLNFSLQYPHFIKRDGNRLLILLQRRKKYKTRTILGYKTLAEGVIRMDAVLQKSMDMTVELQVAGKGGRNGIVLATVRAERVSSIPVDHDNKNINNVLIADRGNEYSDEEEDFTSGDDNEDGSGMMRNFSKANTNYRKMDRIVVDNDPEDVVMSQNAGDSDSDFDPKDKNARTKISRQRNFKQKIVALLKRFKVPEEIEASVNRHGAGPLRPGHELDELFQELESLSCGDGDDSGPDVDSVSIGSTPKPSLRPFFTNSRTTLHENIREERLNDMVQDKLVVGDSVCSIRTAELNDSSGNEAGGGGFNADMDIGLTMDVVQKAINSPPYNVASVEQQPVTEKKLRLFRSNTASVAATGQSGAGSSAPLSAGKKKQSLALTSSNEPKVMWETCLSPTNIEPRKSLLEQLSRTFPPDENALAESIIIVGPTEVHGQNLIARLTTILSASQPIFAPQNTAEVKCILQTLLNKIQKYCNSTAKPPTTMKILLLGGDWLQGLCLRHYVDLLAARPPDWVNHMRFYVVSFGSSSIGRYLSAADTSYALLFGTDNWQQLCERAVMSDPSQCRTEVMEIASRIQKYLHNTGPCTQIPIAEAMVNYKEEESCHIFVPFVSDVRLGCPEGPQLSLEIDETVAQMSNTMLSSSPPNGRLSPPTVTGGASGSGGGIGGIGGSGGNLMSLQNALGQSQQSPMPSTPSQPQQSPQESYELQIDYWPLLSRVESKEAKVATKTTDQGKNSIKSTFRSLQVWRIPPNRQMLGDMTYGLTLVYSTKEKKQKIMRLGKKKEKDRDQDKEHCVEGVARLICSPKQSHPVPLLVYIDGTEWSGVKFFQLSSQWQTHVKNFPVALIGAAPMAAAES